MCYLQSRLFRIIIIRRILLTKGPVIIYVRGGGRRENVSKAKLFLIPPSLLTPLFKTRRTIFPPIFMNLVII